VRIFCLFLGVYFWHTYRAGMTYVHSCPFSVFLQGTVEVVMEWTTDQKRCLWWIFL